MQFTHKQSVANMVYFFIGLAEGLLLLRVVLRFFNGNPNATFVHWAYSNTAVLLEPFRHIFTSTGMVSRGWVVDYVAIFAMAVYALVAYAVLGLAYRWGKK